jgi:hypothetical protein
MLQAFATKPTLRTASRLPTLSREARVSAAELTCLLACGALAVLCVAIFQQMRLPIPGNSILRAVLPMAMGLALVPRRSAGTVMAFGAGLTAAAMSLGHVGRFPPAAVISVVVFGPVLDAALAGQPSGWRLYARFAAAGALANLLAFAVRFATSWLGWDLAGSRQFTDFWLSALPSFVLCGALAGLVSAAVWFRLRVDDDLRRT